MSELRIQRGICRLIVRDGYKPKELIVCVSDATEDADIDLPRLEVLQLRDWLNEWLARTPP